MEHRARRHAGGKNLAWILLVWTLMVILFIPGRATGEEKSTYEWVQVTDSAAWGPRFMHAAVVHNDRIWITGGSHYTESVPFYDLYHNAWL